MACTAAVILLVAVFWAKCEQGAVAGVTVTYTNKYVNYLLYMQVQIIHAIIEFSWLMSALLFFPYQLVLAF